MDNNQNSHQAHHYHSKILNNHQDLYKLYPKASKRNNKKSNKPKGKKGIKNSKMNYL